MDDSQKPNPKLQPLSGDSRTRSSSLQRAERNGNWEQYEKLTGDDGSQLPDSEPNAVDVTFKIKRSKLKKSPFLLAINNIPDHLWG